jgi:hypothetical protein
MIYKYIGLVNFDDFQQVENRVRSNAGNVPHSQPSTSHRLNPAQRDLSLVVVKIILKSALTGLAVLHNQGIVHTGICPAVYLQFARDDSLLFVDI